MITSPGSTTLAPVDAILEAHSYSGLLLAESAQEGLRKGARTELRRQAAVACFGNEDTAKRIERFKMENF